MSSGFFSINGDSIVLNEAICDGASIEFGGNTYTDAGTYVDSLMNQGGQDSVVYLNLSILPVYNDTITAEICSGDSYVFGTSSYSVEGIYTDNLTSIDGCDSIVTLDLTVTETAYTNDIFICEGDYYVFHGDTLYNVGTYSELVTTSGGCMYADIINLNYTPPIYTGPNTVRICEGDTFKIGNSAYTVSGTFEDTFVSGSTGCDSIVITELIVFDAPDLVLTENLALCAGGTVTLEVSGADEFEWQQNSEFTDPTYTFIANTSEYIYIEGTNIYVIVNASDMKCKLVDSIYVQAYPVPVAGPIFGELNFPLWATKTYTIDDSENTTLEWFVEKGEILSGQGTNTIDVYWNMKGVGRVKVVEVNTFDCMNADSIAVNIGMGANFIEAVATEEINIYPNPTSENVTINFGTEMAGHINVKIYNVAGSVVYSQFYSQIENSRVVVETKSFESGVYFVELTENSKTITQKLIIE